MYYMDNIKYPMSLNELSPKYLPSVFIDQKTKQPYQYQLNENGKDYQVCAQIEMTKTQKCATSESSIY